MSENTLKRAAQILASACDGARSTDGSGFNKFDTAKGNALAEMPESEWTEATNAQAYTLLAKYRKQLLKAGFDFSQVQTPDLSLGKVNTEFVTGREGNFEVFFKDFKKLDAVRALPRRRFESGLNPKRWIVPATVEAVVAICELAEKHGFEIKESALDLMSEVYSEEEASVQEASAIEILSELVESRPSPTQTPSVTTSVKYDGKLQAGKTRIVVTFNSIPDVLIRAWMKEVKDWKYSDTKWSFPVSESLKIAQQFRNHEGAAEIIAEAERVYQERLAEIERRKREKVETSKKLLAALDLDAILVNGNPLYKHQKEGIRFLLTEHSALVADQMGLGKAQPLSSKVLTPIGFTALRNISVGSEVYGSDGKPHKVTGVYDKGMKDVYKVTFSDGASTLCCGDHLWTVATHSKFHDSGKFQTMALKEFMHDLKIANGNRKYRIPSYSPVEFEEKKQPIDPYVMGVLLGDGGLSGNAVNITSIDQEIFDEVNRRLPEWYELSEDKGDSNITRKVVISKGFRGLETISANYRRDYRRKFSPSTERCKIKHNAVAQAIYDLNLNCTSEYKFIPKVYLFGSVEQRISILQGLMDTDGHISRGKTTGNRTGNTCTIEYCTVSQRLAEDVRFLVESLGGKAKLSEKITSYVHLGEKKRGKLAYRLNIALDEINPFRLTRKASLFIPREKYKVQRLFESVEFVGQQRCRCIAVDSEDHLYMTDRFILTHNTTQVLIIAKAWQTVYNYPIIVVGPVSLRENWIREAGYCEVMIEYWSWAKQPESPNRPFVLIGDEAHAAQSLASQRTKAFLALAQSDYCKAVIPMTGTPMKNGQPINMYPLLLAIGAEVAEDKAYYQKRYCAGGVDRWGRWSNTGASHLDELHQRTQPVMLRRTKAQCLDLPAKIRTKVPVTLSKDAQALYDKTFEDLRNSYFARLEEAAKKRAEYAELYTSKQIEQEEYEELCSELMSEEGEQLVLLTHLRNAGSIAKIESAIEMAESILEEGNAVVIFTEFVESAKQIAKKLTAYGVELLTGDVTGKDKDSGLSKRQSMVDRFQAGKSKVFVSTFKAGGVGITLTAASDVILVDRPWTPGDTEQGEDRCHRISQKSTVNCQWLQYGKMDQKVDAILEDKTRRIDLVLEGERKTMRGTGNMSQELRNIFNEIVGKK